jgi:Na+-translocating ferredoxin:NAD+ oxidoreductase subunit G
MLTFSFNMVSVRAADVHLKVKLILNIFAVGLTGLLAAHSGPANAYVYLTQEALLASFFPGEVPEVVTFSPDPTALRAVLGYPLPQPSYTLFVGHDANGAPAYGLIDDQVGLHEPITFAVLVDERVQVRQLEVMVYREAYGDGVRSPAFREQFRGLGLAAPMRPGKDIRIVSGATLSTRALSVGTRRACAIVTAWLQQ